MRCMRFKKVLNLCWVESQFLGISGSQMLPSCMPCALFSLPTEADVCALEAFQGGRGFWLVINQITYTSFHRSRKPTKMCYLQYKRIEAFSVPWQTSLNSQKTQQIHSVTLVTQRSLTWGFMANKINSLTAFTNYLRNYPHSLLRWSTKEDTQPRASFIYIFFQKNLFGKN